VILPKKSWNVWNEDNKEKVAKDEAANALLIEAKAKCRRQTLQQIRFERLNGADIGEQEEAERVQHALDTMDITEFIEDQSMQEIARNINAKLLREREGGGSPHRGRKRKLRTTNPSEKEMAFKARKRHKRNDVTMIEDHYSERSSFRFDPDRFAEAADSKSTEHRDRPPTDGERGHFSLFNARDLRNSGNRSGYANPERVHEERRKKEMEALRAVPHLKVGRTEIESRRMKKPWYLMTHRRETERRMLMKADEVQRSLPRRLKDYNRNTDELRAKAVDRKAAEDPMCRMNEFLGKTKGAQPDGARDAIEGAKERKKAVTKMALKQQRKALLRRIKSDRKRASRGDKEQGTESKKKKKKRR